MTLETELAAIGISGQRSIRWNPTVAELYEQAVGRGEGMISREGPLVVRTGRHTGRAPNDRFIVRDEVTEAKVSWGGFNQPFAREDFERLYGRVLSYLQGNDLFVQDLFVGADPSYRTAVRVISEMAWHSLFARNIFVRPAPNESPARPELTIVCVPHFHADPEIDRTNSDAFIVLDFKRGIALVGGTQWAGELKKAAFAFETFHLPDRDVLPMHSSINVGAANDPAIFFGLSGSGKTTLSSDPQRRLIGDDETAWSDSGMYNLEGGSYARAINLTPESDPQIYGATQRFGTLLENVSVNPASREVDFANVEMTRNSRSAYPSDHFANADADGRCGHARKIIMLTTDAFGVLPPAARLTPEQASYHFLSGYTAKLPDTESGIVEPQATFSSCFGAPFMLRPFTTYGEMLRRRIREHNVETWLVNTGWIGGPYGAGGERISLEYTRSLVSAILAGTLDSVDFESDELFQLSTPLRAPGVPADVLNPRRAWPDAATYDAQALRLAGWFGENFDQFESSVSAEIAAAGPSAT